jgi:hypothetical protein
MASFPVSRGFLSGRYWLGVRAGDKPVKAVARRFLALYIGLNGKRAGIGSVEMVCGVVYYRPRFGGVKNACNVCGADILCAKHNCTRRFSNGEFERFYFVLPASDGHFHKNILKNIHDNSSFPALAGIKILFNRAARV